MQQQKKTALIGDIGGTNIRFELVEVDLQSDSPIKIKEAKFNVADHPTFQGAIETFLAGVSQEDYPQVAALAIAGPITDNTAFMANAEKWGTIDGNQLSHNLKIPHFQLLNDFEAASYGILLVPDQQFVSLNGLKANPKKIRGIMGPGTGLGNSVLYPIKVKEREEVVVICSEGGHIDFPTIDEQTAEYFKFFCKQGKFEYISLQRSFCGPSFPYMFKFFCQKYPEDKEAKQPVPSSQKIIQVAVSPNPPRIYDCVFNLFVKIYSAAIANFVTHHLTVGGMYLVNSITCASIPRLMGQDLLASFRHRHPDVAKLVTDVPLVVCKVVELGMKGAFFIARRIYSQI